MVNTDSKHSKPQLSIAEKLRIRLVLSITDTAEALGVCRGTVYNLIKAGALTRVSVANAPRITVDSLRRYMAALEGGAS